MRKQITVVIVQIGPILKNITLEPVCCKKQQKNPDLWFVEQGTFADFEWYSKASLYAIIVSWKNVA